MAICKTAVYGLYMGALFMPLIVLSQAVFPSRRSDDDFGGLILGVYLATFLYYGAVGFLGACGSSRQRDGARIGALTAVVGMGLIIATFAAVDNLFLETVSKQVDKIRGFEHMSSPHSICTVYLYSQFIFLVNLV